MNKIKHLSNNNFLYLGIFLTGIILFLWNNNYTAIWFDESFSILLSQKSFTEIAELTSRDVHPPLYYWMLKIYCSILGYSISAIRFFSLIPIILILALGGTVFRKTFGNLSALVFMILVITMPVMLYVVSEIRMYSWTMLWVFLTAIFAYKSYYSLRLSNIIPYLLFSLAAAYSHNYGLLTIFSIYAVIFILLLINKKEKVLLFLGLGIIITILYTPWLIQLIKQMLLVKEEYWIQTMNFKDLIGAVFFPLDFHYPEIKYPSIINWLKSKFFILFILFSIIIIIKAQFNQNKKNVTIANLSLLLYILPAIIAIFISYLIKPIFFSRYLICSLIFLFIAYSIYISLLDYSKKIDKLLVSFFLSILIVISTTNFILNKHWTNEKEHIQTTFVNYVKDNMDDKTAFVSSEIFCSSIGVYSVFLPEVKQFAFHKDSLNQLHRTVLKCLPYTSITDISEIDTTYTQIFCVENYGGKENVLDVPSDSTNIVKCFDVKDKLVLGMYRYSLYRLERKREIE